MVLKRNFRVHFLQEEALLLFTHMFNSNIEERTVQIDVIHDLGHE